jgi:hypothetical protein
MQNALRHIDELKARNRDFEAKLLMAGTGKFLHSVLQSVLQRTPFQKNPRYKKNSGNVLLFLNKKVASFPETAKLLHPGLFLRSQFLEISCLKFEFHSNLRQREKQVSLSLLHHHTCYP